MRPQTIWPNVKTSGDSSSRQAVRVVTRKSAPIERYGEQPRQTRKRVSRTLLYREHRLLRLLSRLLRLSPAFRVLFPFFIHTQLTNQSSFDRFYDWIKYATFYKLVLFLKVQTAESNVELSLFLIVNIKSLGGAEFAKHCGNEVSPSCFKMRCLWAFYVDLCVNLWLLWWVALLECVENMYVHSLELHTDKTARKTEKTVSCVSCLISLCEN